MIESAGWRQRYQQWSWFDTDEESTFLGIGLPLSGTLKTLRRGGATLPLRQALTIKSALSGQLTKQSLSSFTLALRQKYIFSHVDMPLTASKKCSKYYSSREICVRHTQILPSCQWSLVER